MIPGANGEVDQIKAAPTPENPTNPTNSLATIENHYSMFLCCLTNNLQLAPIIIQQIQQTPSPSLVPVVFQTNAFQVWNLKQIETRCCEWKCLWELMGLPIDLKPKWSAITTNWLLITDDTSQFPIRCWGRRRFFIHGFIDIPQIITCWHFLHM